MATGDLTTASDVRAFVGVKSDQDDELIGALVSAASEAVKSWLSRDILSQPYTRIFHGHGGYDLVMPEYPVTAVSSVAIDGISVPAAAAYGQPGYRFDENQVWLTGYRFTKGFGNVSVTWQAGYPSVPRDIAEAVRELVSLVYKERERIGMSSKSVQGETTAYIVKEMPDRVRMILQPYRKVVPC